MQLGVEHLASRMHADTFEEIDDGDVAPFEAAGKDRSAVDEYARHVEAQHRHHHAGKALVAPRGVDKRLGDQAALGQRRESEQRRGRITARRRGQLGTPELVSVELGEPVDGLPEQLRRAVSPYQRV